MMVTDLNSRGEVEAIYRGGKSPFVSVIIPVFNGEKYLASAIESVLSQTYSHYEVIVVDDGSTDSTRQVAQLFEGRVRYFFKEHSGLGATLNWAIKKARGEYFAFLDADDLWVRNKLELQLDTILKPNVDMVFGYVEQFISPELSGEKRRKISCPKKPEIGIVKGTLLIGRETFLKVGMFAVEYRVGEFIEWYMRAKGMGLKAEILPIVLMKRRIHKTNTTTQGKAIMRDYVRALKSGLDRRRAKA